MQASSPDHRFHGRATRCAAWLLALSGLAACEREQPAPPVSGGDARQGELLLARFQCGACHRIPGVEGAAGTAGPSLANFARRSYIAGHLPNDPEVMVHWIVDPKALHPGATMPAMGVSPDDARHMAAYLYTLK